jgi:geranylgeranyl diphosphate synthase, type II
MIAQVESVAARLGRYHELTAAAMERFLGANDHPPYLYDLVREYPGRGGKGVRPALLLATCQAFGRPWEEALQAAVALEMLHNAFLVHDDVEDQSALRRGQPTLHELHGLGLAVNAGDALASLALRPLLEDAALSIRLKERLVAELSAAVQQTTEGQALDLGWRWDNLVDLAPAEYLTMAGKKTCWYSTVAPLRMGAIIGSAGTAGLRVLSRFGVYLGIAFQIRDDLLDLEYPSISGKEPFGDVREGKRTLILIHLLATAGAKDRDWLEGYLRATPSERSGDVLRVHELMQRQGSLSYAQECACGVERAAYRVFDDAFAGVRDSEHLDFLRDLVPYMLARPR